MARHRGQAGVAITPRGGAAPRRDEPATSLPSGAGAGEAGPLEAATKQALLWTSQSLESLAARLVDLEAPVAVLALFETPEYFAYERERYAALAEHATVLVGFAGPRPDTLPERVGHLPLGDDETLAEEWVVLVVSPVVCAGMVATDLKTVAPASSLERGRLFRPDLSVDAGWVTAQVERIADLAGSRLDAAALARLRELGHAARHRPESDRDRVLRETLTEQWWRTARVAVRAQGEAQLAYTDSLTGARNRRFLDRYLERMGPRTPPVAAVLFDIDDFKTLNDTHGHVAGDEVLQRFAGLVDQQTRDTDVLIRLGGDEWLLLLPGMGLARARERAERLVSAFQDVAAQEDSGATTTLSAGVGVFAADALDLDAVDEAMYRAKQAGGGQVAVHHGQD